VGVIKLLKYSCTKNVEPFRTLLAAVALRSSSSGRHCKFVELFSQTLAGFQGLLKCTCTVKSRAYRTVGHSLLFVATLMRVPFAKQSCSMAKHVLIAVLLVAAVFCHAAASEEEGKDVIKLINDKAKPTEDFETQVRIVQHAARAGCFHTALDLALVGT
jgi:hypothetical protein